MKSDDVTGRTKTYEAIVKGENIPESGIPESFKVLVKEMQSLCLDVQIFMKDEEESVELQEEDDFSGIDMAHLRDMIDQIDENTLDAHELANAGFIEDFTLSLSEEDARF